MMLAVAGAVLAGAVGLFALGNALGAKGRHQRAADLAAISAAQVMRDLYPRLFEPPFLAPDVPNPRHLEEGEYRASAVAAAIRGGKRNGVHVKARDVSFPGAAFAATRVRVRVVEGIEVGPPDRRASTSIETEATAEISPSGGGGFPSHAAGGGYSGPLAYRQGEPLRSIRRTSSGGAPTKGSVPYSSASSGRSSGSR